MHKLNKKQLIDFRDEGVFDLDASLLGPEIRSAALDCIACQKQEAAGAFADFVPRLDAREQTSAAALQRVLDQGKDVHGISTDRSISNVISFRKSGKADGIASERVERSRKKVDQLVERMLIGLFDSDREITVTSSGHFWYPAGSYMAWHTNSKVPGWRMYINYAEEERKSYFRYRDPGSGEIITLHDGHWNLRLFRITAEKPVWHTIYSNTNRFSLGYVIREQRPASLIQKVVRKTRRFVGG